MIDNSSVYLIELQNKLFDTTGTWVHESTICHTVHRLGFTRKKLQHIAFGRSEGLRAKFIADISIHTCAYGLMSLGSRREILSEGLDIV